MTTFDILLIIATVISALLLFGITVFVHELGHFIAARWMGLYVDRFAIGMGPVACKFNRNGVEYSIRWLPLGGFVSIPQMLPMDSVEGKVENLPKNLPSASPLAKIVTAFFGPLFSLGLGFVAAVLVFFIGKNVNVATLTTTIGYVDKDSPAYAAGIQPGDKIVSINGVPVKHWVGGSDSVWNLSLLSPGKELQVIAERDGRENSYQLLRRPDPDPLADKIPTVGFERYVASTLVVSSLFKDYPAAKAGLKKGDVLKRLDGRELYSLPQMKELINNTMGPFDLEFERDGASHSITLTAVKLPALDGKKEDKGIGIKEWKSGPYQITHPNPLRQVGDSLSMMVMTIKALVTPKSGIGLQQMSGPLGIFHMIYNMIMDGDFRTLLVFCVFFNVNLAVLNLFPFPILDGGHIVFSCVEAIRRRPLDVKVVNTLMTCSMVLLLFFFLVVTFYDSGRLGRDIKGSSVFSKDKSIIDKIETTE
jgi:regulator of sigma E protease